MVDGAGWSPLRVALVAIGFGAILIPPAAAILPVALQREQHGFDLVIQGACDLLPPDSAALVVGTFDEAALPQALRSWCGVPTASAGMDLVSDPDWLTTAAINTEAAGHTLTLVSSDHLPARVEGQLTNQVQTESVLATNRLEHTIERRPSAYLLPELLGTSQVSTHDRTG